MHYCIDSLHKLSFPQHMAYHVCSVLKVSYMNAFFSHYFNEASLKESKQYRLIPGLSTAWVCWLINIILTKITAVWPISLLLFGLCFLLLPHQSGVTFGHLSGLWSRPFVGLWEYSATKAYLCSERKEKDFFVWKSARISKEILLARRGSVKSAWFRDNIFDLPRLSDQRVLDKEVGMALRQNMAKVCPGLVSRKAGSAHRLRFFVGDCWLHEKCCCQTDSPACFAHNTG